MFTYQGEPVSPLSQVPMDSFNQYQNVVFGRSPEQQQAINAQTNFLSGGIPANPLSQVPMDPQNLLGKYQNVVFGRSPEQQQAINAQTNFFSGGIPANPLSQVPMDPQNLLGKYQNVVFGQNPSFQPPVQQNLNFNPRPPTQSFFTGQTIVPTNTVNPMSQMPGDEFLNMVKPNKQVEQMPQQQMPQQQMPTMERPQQEQFLPNQLPNVPVPGVLGQTGSMFNNLLNNTNPVLQAPIIQTPSTVTKSPSNLGQVIGKQLTRPTMSRTPIRQPVVQRRPVTRSAPRIVR